MENFGTKSLCDFNQLLCRYLDLLFENGLLHIGDGFDGAHKGGVGHALLDVAVGFRGFGIFALYSYNGKKGGNFTVISKNK